MDLNNEVTNTHLQYVKRFKNKLCGENNDLYSVLL